MQVRINFILTVTTLFLASIFWLLALNMNGFLWDIEVYQFAVDSSRAGKDPYLNRSGFDYMYHPITLPVLEILSHITSLQIILPVIYFAALLVLLAILRNLQLISKSIKESMYVNLLLLLSGFFGWCYLGIFSGNLSILGHLVLHSIGFQLIIRRNTGLKIIFCVTILVFSLIKPYFLAYLILYLAISLNSFFMFGAVSVAGFCAMWFLFPINDSESYSRFTQNLTRGTFKNEDLGFSFFSTFQKHLGTCPGLVFHFSVILFLIFIYFKYKSELSLRSQSIWLLTIAIASNPRIKEYDAIFLLLLTLIAFGLSLIGARKVVLIILTLTSISGVALAVTLLIPCSLSAPTIYLFGAIALVWSIWFLLKNAGPTK